MAINRLMQMAAAGADAFPGAGNAWDVSTAQWLGEPINYFDASASLPLGLFFKPDGLKMYLTGPTNDEVDEYDLSTAWDVTSASLLQSLDVSTQEGQTSGLFFKPDGLKMYIVGFNGDEVNEYNLSTAWDISSASHLQTFDVSAQDAIPRGIFFKPDGAKMYIVGSIGNSVYEYDLSTAWDISSASISQTLDVSSQDTEPRGIFFKPDGLKMYVVGDTDDDINEYDLSTAWDISSASYLQNLSVVSQSSSPAGLFFKPDGTEMFLVGAQADFVYPYDLSTAWDISSATYPGDPTTSYLGVGAQDVNPQNIFFKPDGSKMYFVGIDGDDVNEYDLSTTWDISSASFLQSFSVSSKEIQPRGIFFKPDGTKMYIVGASSDSVHEYDLSTAWDISSASFLQSFSVSSQEVVPFGLFFKPDGLKMYLSGLISDSILEYDLSTAWDISSASHLQNFNVLSEDSSPLSVFFKPDGLKMYFVGSVTDKIYEYNLSTAWDVSSASLLQSFDLSSEDRSALGVFFKPDGLKMYISGDARNAIFEYDL